MSESTAVQTPENGAVGPEGNGERSDPQIQGPGTPEGGTSLTEGGSGGGEADPDTFSREYVQKLREEASGHRVKAQRADQLSEGWYRSAVELATAGVLRDPSDLPRSEHHFSADGSPDLERIREDAEALANAKPHLARPRVPAAQLQGPTDQPPPPVGLGSILRQAAF